MATLMPRVALVLSLLALSCGNEGAWARQEADRTVPGLDSQDPATRLRAAQAAVRTGRYEDGIRVLQELSAMPSSGPTARRALVRALAEVGRYDEAETAARRFAGEGNGVQLQAALGDVLAARGKLSEAERAYTSAVRGAASDSLTARLRLAELRWARGERAEALREFDHYIDVYNERRSRLSAEELTAVAVACWYLGATNPELFKDALKAFEAAIARDPEDLTPRIGAAELLLAKHNGGDAKASIDEVLAINPSHPRALVAAARRQYDDGEGGALLTARKALETNPNHVAAHAFVAQLLLDTEQHAEAIAEAEKALAVNASSSDALAMLAAAKYLQGDRAGYQDARRRALASNPRDAEFFATLAEVSGRHRLYREAAAFAAEGTALDSASWTAQGVLGINQLRNGEIAEGRASLERAFKGDPYDVRVKNTLDLLDTFKGYRDVRSPRFLFMAENKDADLLALYLGELAEEAYDKLAVRYAYRPPTPVRVELYRSHEDFSVRTVGLAGIGALGVAFGTTLAMDSPAAREMGEFNWGSTFWHELAHTFTLGASEHRVPRWLSEGLSVLEERRARGGWGAGVTPDFLAAYKGGLLVPVSRMNDGFMRPRYPQQVIHSYYQASLVCELIEREFGAQALPQMLQGYREGLTTPQVFQRVLKTDPEAFDTRFARHLDERFRERARVIGEMRLERDTAEGGRARTGVRPPRADAGGAFAQAMGRAMEAMEAGREDEAVKLLGEAKALFPEYTGPGSAYHALAAIHQKRGNARGATAELRAIVESNESDVTAHTQLAALLEQAGDRAGAADVLERAMYIWPFDPKQHERLATLYAATGNRAKLVRERRAIVALNPVDRAEALYQLALALEQAGDAAAARREVLKALEEAPNFEKAQELLLRLPRGTTPQGRS